MMQTISETSGGNGALIQPRSLLKRKAERITPQRYIRFFQNDPDCFEALETI